MRDMIGLVLLQKEVHFQMITEKWFFMKYLWSAILGLYFHPAEFENFKDEKMPEYKTVSVAQSKNLLDWKPARQFSYVIFLAFFF